MDIQLESINVSPDNVEEVIKDLEEKYEDDMQKHFMRSIWFISKEKQIPYILEMTQE